MKKRKKRRRVREFHAHSFFSSVCYIITYVIVYFARVSIFNTRESRKCCRFIPGNGALAKRLNTLWSIMVLLLLLRSTAAAIKKKTFRVKIEKEKKHF